MTLRKGEDIGNGERKQQIALRGVAVDLSEGRMLNE